jgi:hypothetical protein
MELIERAQREGIGRRAFLGLLGLSLLALLPDPASALRRRAKKKLVYRLSSRGHHACSACKGHAANRFYETRQAADADRAHVGCHCAIVSQRIPRRLARQYFKQRSVFDLRGEAIA